jgi:adenosylmethionine-8-amino-7-oxononanoate aminotransferase
MTSSNRVLPAATGRADKDRFLEADVAHVVHPLTTLAARDPAALLMVTKGQGMSVTDIHGREYLDACAGLWNVNVGYGRKDIAKVAARELEQLGFGMLYIGRSTPPAAMLAARLAEIVPGRMQKFFFGLGGSDGNDTAIKLARRYHYLRDKATKTAIIGRTGSYHGSCYGAMSATGEASFWEGFGPLVPGFSHIDQPTRQAADAADQLEREILRLGPDRVAAFIAEPVSVPCGVVVPPPDYWGQIREICTRFDVLLIADEVITGFGRTGRMFALEHWGVTPDLIVMAKGLTSGYLPLSAVGIDDDVYDVISAAAGPFMHGFTAGGHPACCAVALRNIEILEEEGLVANARTVGDYLLSSLSPLIDDGLASDVRALGLMAAVDFARHPENVSRFDDTSVGKAIEHKMREEGILVRAFGDTVAIAPPLIVTRRHVDHIVGSMRRVATAVRNVPAATASARN